MRITIIDMDLGNLDSVCHSFQRVGAAIRVTQDPREIPASDALVLPGVGAFGDGMAGLERHGLCEPVRQFALHSGRPVLGICLGMQLLADASDEHGEHRGLALIPGRNRRLTPTSTEYRVPNMGWCDVTPRTSGAPFERVGEAESFFFAHSYHFECEDQQHVAATIEYDGRPIAAAVQAGNLVGVQFHPEKSQDAGLQVIDSFVRGCIKSQDAGLLPA